VWRRVGEGSTWGRQWGERAFEEEETYVYNKPQSMFALIYATSRALNVVSSKLTIGTNLNTFKKKLGSN